MTRVTMLFAVCACVACGGANARGDSLSLLYIGEHPATAAARARGIDLQNDRDHMDWLRMRRAARLQELRERLARLRVAAHEAIATARRERAERYAQYSRYVHESGYVWFPQVLLVRYPAEAGLVQAMFLERREVESGLGTVHGAELRQAVRALRERMREDMSEPALRLSVPEHAHCVKLLDTLGEMALESPPTPARLSALPARELPVNLPSPRRVSLGSIEPASPRNSAGTVRPQE